jgi:hypothetical protein
MNVARALALTGFASALAAAACSGSSSPSNGPDASTGDASAIVCAPGQSIACVGVGGCSGGQACAADGRSYDACECVASGDAGMPADASGDAGADGTLDGASLDGSSDAAVDAGMLDPTALGSGLALWLDDATGAIVLSGNSVVTWKDQSGHSLDVSAAVSGAPTLDPSRLNGHALVDFAILVGLDTTASLAGVDFGGDFVVEAVAIESYGPDAAGVGGTIWAAEGTSNAYVQMRANGTVETVLDTSNGTMVSQTTAPESSGAAHVFGLRRYGSPATLEARVDGVTSATADVSQLTSLDGSSAGLTVGRNLMGRIAEVIVYTGTLSDTQTRALEGYLTAKYALP